MSRMNAVGTQEKIEVIKIVGIAGSLRLKSFNRALLRAAAESMPPDSQMQIMPIEEIPLYNADVEAEAGIPSAVTRAKAALADAHGLVIATPEYNGGIPGIAKNAIDWMSRPADDISRVFQGKWVALMGATPGGWGTVFAQSAWLPVLRKLRMQMWTDAGPFYVSHANSVFDDNGLADAEQRSRLVAYMTAYVDRIRRAVD